jgi:hypothetical protein
MVAKLNYARLSIGTIPLNPKALLYCSSSLFGCKSYLSFCFRIIVMPHFANLRIKRKERKKTFEKGIILVHILRSIFPEGRSKLKVRLCEGEKNKKKNISKLIIKPFKHLWLVWERRGREQEEGRAIFDNYC